MTTTLWVALGICVITTIIHFGIYINSDFPSFYDDDRDRKINQFNYIQDNYPDRIKAGIILAIVIALTLSTQY